MAHSSIGNMTNTLIETGSRHMQQCRTNYDVLLSMAGEKEDELINDDDKWCMAKDELVVSCGKHIINNAPITATKYAYPSVITTLGDLSDEQKCSIASYYHFLGDATKVEDNFKTINKGVVIKTDDSKTMQMRNFMPVGYSVGHACAHPAKGDTVASVQIGGLRTVINGAFEVQTNDLIQMYIPDAEHLLFDKEGGRLAIDRKAFKDQLEGKSVKNPAVKTDSVTNQRKNFYSRGNGIKGGINSSTRVKTGVFSIKPYLECSNENQHQYSGDKMRVFAKAVSSARPFEPVDIMISRQSL
jgi:hypothetical protein